MPEQIGPKVSIEAHCGACVYKRSESYRAQGDSGWNHYCEHPDRGGKSIDSYAAPSWCPLRDAAIDRATGRGALGVLRKVDEDARRVEGYLGRQEPASPLLAEIRALLKEVG